MSWKCNPKSIGRLGATLGSLAVLSVGVSACSGPQLAETERAVLVPSASQAELDIAPSDLSGYTMRSGDVVSITVFREPELSTDRAIVSPDGSVSLPLLGEVQLAGARAGEVERELEQMLEARFLRDADVAINVIEYASHLVTVEGAVEEPGIYPFQPGTRLSGAIALAQGLERSARSRDIAVFRDSTDGVLVAKFDYSAIRAGSMADPVLVPGDRVVIGTDGLSQFWQDFLRALPAFGLFTQL